MIVGVALVIASGGATNEYSQAFLLLLTGGLLIFTPIRKLPEHRISLALLAIMAWMFISTWLPFPFETASDWVASKRPGLSVGAGISAQPVLSGEKSLFFFVGLCWFLLVIQKPLHHYRRLEVLRLALWMVALLALFTVSCVITNIQHPFTWGTHRFSFFPNHNQSGAIFAMGGILSLGFLIRSMRRREWNAVAYLGALIVICLAVFMGMSRSAVIALFGGCAIYILLTLERKNFRFYVKIGVPIILVFGASFIVYGGKLLDEFMSLLSIGGVNDEIRVRIWMDATRMALAFPILGVGLGNFRYFFPYFIDSVSTPQAIYHPESDFLWVWTELGLVGLLLVIAAIVFLFIRLDPKDVRESKGVRLAGFVAIFMFLLASLIEVSGHRLGTAMMALLIYGLIQPEHAKFHKIKGLKWASRGVGAMLMILALSWIYLMVIKIPVVSSQVFAFSEKRLSEIYETYDPESFDHEIDRWLQRYPMVAVLHDLKGISAITSGNLERAVEGFDSAHALNPVWWKPYINHGIYIYSFDFDTALRYWRTGLSLAGNQNVEALEFIIGRIPSTRIVELRDLTYGDRDLQFFFLSKLRRRPIDYSKEMGLELAINPELNGFSSEQKQALLWSFSEINGPAMLRRLLDRYPSLGTENWSIRSLLRAGEGAYKDAARLAVMNYPEPQMIDLTKGRTQTAIRTEYLLDSKDPLKVIALVQKQKQDGNYEDAIVTLEISRGKGVSHPYLEYQRALVNFHLGQYEESWNIFKRIIERSIDWSVDREN